MNSQSRRALVSGKDTLSGARYLRRADIAIIGFIFLISATISLAQAFSDQAATRYAAPLHDVAESAVDSPSLQGANTLSTDSAGTHIFWVPGYLWLSGLSGNVGAKGIAIPVNASFSNIFNNLNLGYMTALDVRHRRAGLLFDLVYIKLTTQERSTPFGLLYSTARTRSKMFFVVPEVYGRVVETKRFSVDATAGARVWRLDNGVDLRAGILKALSVDDTQSWADPLLGGRFRVNLSRGFYATLKGDAGIGPNETWEIDTGVGKEFKKRYSAILAYRRLDVHYRNGGFLYDTSMNGVLLGFGIRFE